MNDKEEETALGYMLRKLREEEQPMWDSLWADLKEQDREELKRLKAVDAAREEKLTKRRQLYADNKGRNTN